MIPKIITIAGSDSSGGAGLQADLKTFQEYGTFGFSAITSFVTMDPDHNWSHEIAPTDATLLEKQLKTIYAGRPLQAGKTGMLGSVENAEMASFYLEKFNQENLVVDPVMACKGTTELLQPELAKAMIDNLLPKALITTPNLTEAGILSQLGELTSTEQMEEAARKISLLGPKYVLIKGGHRLKTPEAIDVLYDGKNFTYLVGEKYQTDFNHGAGCTFAAAVTAGIGKGYSVEKAAKLAKDFVNAGIKNGLKINPFLGHVWHGAYNKAENRMEG